MKDFRQETLFAQEEAGAGEGAEDTVLGNLLLLIEERFETVAAFEKAAGLPAKTVSNWRRGRSRAYWKQLPALAAVLRVRTADLLPPEGADAEETAFLRLYRRSAALFPEERRRFLDSLRELMTIYIDSHLHRRSRSKFEGFDDELP